MFGNALIRVKNCTENDALALVYYLYQICSDARDFESHEECQVLYNALVDKLGLHKHAESVMDALIYRLEKGKFLIPMEVGPKYCHPFGYKGKLKVNYREDDIIAESCGNFSSDTLMDINLIRILFSSEKKGFQKLLALTFFTEPGSLQNKTVALSGKTLVSEKIKKAVDDISSVQFAINSLKLSKDEAKVLQVAYRLQSIKEMYDVCNDFYQNNNLSRIEMYSRCIGKSQKDIRMLLKNDQKLKAFGLLDEDGDMDQDALDTIHEQDMRLYFTDIVKPEKTSKTYDPDSFSISREKTDIAVQLLKSSNACNILLYGAAGAGKTQYAKTLIKQSGLKMVSYKNELEVSDGETSEKKALNRLNCYLSLKKDDQILVVDEAEKILQTREFNFFGMNLSSGQKGTVNNMLEKSENKCIFIVNYTSEMDESTLRRFTYSIKFNAMPKETLRTIASEKLNSLKMPVSLKNDILDMCGQYKVTGASVENVVKAIKSLDYQKGKEDKVRSDVKSVLEANSSLIYGKKTVRDTVSKSYDLSVLNTTVPANDIVEMLEVSQQYKMENPDDNNIGVRCLWYGISGTGKTELARYVAMRLQKPLLLKRCSDLISPYVGQTEINIREAFDEALSSDSVLLIDEADSFFSDRANARYGFERQMTNEFLNQLEEFSGIVIACTNLRKILDPAVMRRFHLVTEFKALNEEGINTLLKSFFGKYRFTEEQIQKLSRYSTVTPGDFGSLGGRIRFIPKDKLNADYLISELVKIQEEKLANGNARIGFAS